MYLHVEFALWILHFVYVVSFAINGSITTTTTMKHCNRRTVSCWCRHQNTCTVFYLDVHNEPVCAMIVNRQPMWNMYLVRPTIFNRFLLFHINIKIELMSYEQMITWSYIKFGRGVFQPNFNRFRFVRISLFFDGYFPHFQRNVSICE